MNRLLVDVSEGIRVLQSRDGILLSEGQILERARNIVMGLVGNYRIESLEGDLDGVANSNGASRPLAPALALAPARRSDAAPPPAPARSSRPGRAA